MTENLWGYSCPIAGTLRAVVYVSEGTTQQQVTGIWNGLRRVKEIKPTALVGTVAKRRCIETLFEDIHRHNRVVVDAPHEILYSWLEVRPAHIVSDYRIVNSARDKWDRDF